MTLAFQPELALTPAEASELAVLESVIERGLASFVEVGAALARVRDARLYRTGFATFEDYCGERWGIARQRAYQLMGAAEVTERLSKSFDTLPANDAQARAVAAAPVELQPEVWQRAVETAPNGHVTAEHVRRVIDAFPSQRVIVDTSGPVPIVSPVPNRDSATLLTRIQGAPESSDHFQTPPRYLAPILPHLKRNWTVWECAEGGGNLSGELRAKGYRVVGSDVGSGQDFLTWEPDEWDCIVTNPPYSLKDEFLARCYGLGKPFALLLPIAALGEQGRMALYRQHGVQVVLPPERINFETPSGEGSGSWFFTAWFLGFFGLERDLTFWSPEGGR